MALSRSRLALVEKATLCCAAVQGHDERVKNVGMLLDARLASGDVCVRLEGGRERMTTLSRCLCPCLRNARRATGAVPVRSKGFCADRVSILP